MTIRLLNIMIISFGLWLCNCAGSDPDTRLVRIEEMASVSPEEALDSLKAVQYDKLKEADRHYYDFLSVKVPDKAYVHHITDSLILKVIDYESRHPETGRYVEALYYGARVYSDLGDYYYAQKYFEKAIEHISNCRDEDLKARIYSQFGRLLSNLRLYQEALPYLKKALEIGKLQNDTVNTVYDLQLLGQTYIQADSLETSKKYLDEAIQLSHNLPIYHKAKSFMCLAEIKLKTGEIDSALYYIRGIPEKVKPKVRDTALAHASRIYAKAGISDTSYYYAKKLIESSDSALHYIGYESLLSPALRESVPRDSLDTYISNYRGLLENFYNENGNQLALIQRTFYNYDRHRQEKEITQKKNFSLIILSLVILSVALLLSVGLIYYKNRNQKHILQLRNSLDNIRILKTQLNNVVNEKKNESDTESDNEMESAVIAGQNLEIIKSEVIPHSKYDKHDLREQLKNELLSLYENSKERTEISPLILKSETYQIIEDHLAEEKVISEKSALWNEIELMVLRSSPDFKVNLQLLSCSTLTNVDYRTALLIKCGLRPAQLAILFGRSNGTIVSRRESLCLRIFGRKMGTKFIDGIIRLL